MPRRPEPPRLAHAAVRAAAVLSLGSLSLAVAAVAAPAAVSAEISSAVTSVSLAKTDFWAWESVRANLGWSVPDSARAGDTFSLRLPDELVPASTVGFDLRDQDGVRVATAVWEGSTAVVTLDDFVEGRTGVSGSIFFDVVWNRELMGTAPTERVLDLFGTPVTVTVLGDGDDVAPEQSVGTWGYWHRADQGVVEPLGAVGWRTRFPSRDDGFDGPVTVTQTLDLGQALDCGSLSVTGKVGPGTETPEYSVLPAMRERVKILGCSPAGFILELDEIRPGEMLMGDFTADLTEGERLELSTEVTIEYSGVEQETSAQLRRTLSGGEGTGAVVPAPPTSPPGPVPPTPTPVPVPAGPVVPVPPAPSVPEPEGPVAPVPARPATPEPEPRAPQRPGAGRPGLLATALSPAPTAVTGVPEARRTPVTPDDRVPGTLAATGAASVPSLQIAGASLVAGAAALAARRSRRGALGREGGSGRRA